MSDQDQGRDKDPVVHSSLSKHLFIWSAVLVAVLGWSLYDEMYGIRPWKTYEARFAKAYGRFLRNAEGGEAATEKQIRSSPEFQRLERDIQAAEKQVTPQIAAIDKEINESLVPRIMALNDPFQEVRSHIGALTYQIETTASEGRKESLRKQIAGLKQETRSVKLPGDDQPHDYTYAQMDQTLQQMKARKAQLLDQRVALLKPANELRAKREKYL